MTVLTLSPRTILRWHLAIASLLTLAYVAVSGVALVFNVADMPGLHRFFNLRAAANPADFFASLALLATAAAGLWVHSAEAGGRARLFFAIIAAAMLVLAVEELVEAHHVIWRLRGHPGALAAFAAGLAAIVAATGAGLMATMGGVALQTRVRLALGGLVFVLGVTGEIVVTPFTWEILERIIPSWTGVDVLTTAMTEGLEMLGVAFILHTLLRHAGRIGARLEVTIARDGPSA